MYTLCSRHIFRHIRHLRAMPAGKLVRRGQQHLHLQQRLDRWRQHTYTHLSH